MRSTSSSHATSSTTSERLGEPLVGPHGHVMCLEPQSLDPEPRHLVGEGLPERARVRDALDVGHLVPRLLRVAPVGEERAVAGGDEDLPVRPREPGEVANVR